MSERMDYPTLAPGAMDALAEVGKYVAKAGFRKAFIDVVYLRVSQINGCAYCIDLHTRDLLKEGFTVEKIMLVQAFREGGDLFTAREKAALAWAETVTRVSETGVPDEEYEAARKEFSEKELVDLTVIIGLMNAYNRLAISFRRVPASVKLAKAAT